MRGLRAGVQNWRWPVTQLLRGAATLAVLPRSDQPVSSGGDWSSAGTDQKDWLTTPALQNLFTSQTPYIDGTPTTGIASPDNLWSIENITQHHRSDGAPEVQKFQDQPTTSWATDVRVPYPPNDQMLSCPSHSIMTSAPTKAIGEQWLASVGPVSDCTDSDSLQQGVSNKTTHDVSYRDVAAKHLASQEPVNAVETLVSDTPESMNVRDPGERQASRKRCAESGLCQPFLEEPLVAKVARLLTEEPNESMEILRNLLEGTEVHYHTPEALQSPQMQSHYNAVHSITHEGVHYSQRGMVKTSSGAIAQMGIPDQGPASDNLQPNITDSTGALEGSQRTQTEHLLAESSEVPTEPLSPIGNLIDQYLEDAGNGGKVTAVRSGVSWVGPLHGTAHLDAPLVHTTQHPTSHELNCAEPERPTFDSSIVPVNHESVSMGACVEATPQHSDIIDHIQDTHLCDQYANGDGRLEEMVMTKRPSEASWVELSRGTAPSNAPLFPLARSAQHSAYHQDGGAGPAKHYTILNPPSTVDTREFETVEVSTRPSPGRSDTMGYIRRLDESGNLGLYPVSFADYSGALSFDQFRTRGLIEQIVLPRDPSQYLQALYDSVKRFKKKGLGSRKPDIIKTSQQHDDERNGPIDDFRVIRARSKLEVGADQWAGMIKAVEGWLDGQSKDSCDDFARFALGYFKLLDRWRNYRRESSWLEGVVAAWCEQHQGLSEALKLVAAPHPSLTGTDSLLITLPDIYTRTCPYFLMYAVHHPSPEKPSSPGTSKGQLKFDSRSLLLYELTTAAYLWQMVLHVRGEAEEPEWPSQPLLTGKLIRERQRREWIRGTRRRSDYPCLAKSAKRYSEMSLAQLWHKFFNQPLILGRFHPEILAQIQVLEASTPAPKALNLYDAVGSFTNTAAAPFKTNHTLQSVDVRAYLPVEGDHLQAFWRLRVLFHACTGKIVRYQLDKLIVETESKMKSGLLPKDEFLSFACDYLRAMRIWDTLANARQMISRAPTLFRELFSRFSDKYKVTDAVKKVAEIEPHSSECRMLPEIYKTHPASSLLPYVTWFDTSKPGDITEFLSRAGITMTEATFDDGNGGRDRAVTSRLLTIIAEIWKLREINHS
eukprot:Blabericola_migrator_1__2706@NODE_176_length_11972_cov_72_986308_g153_i0_p2_GENE_NODE_176_length_11972_cov_72_986308_g153_i0NODE_176_length_11972_cov_72_986308_g153_i0_p2_ORF_typecomplete_len1109_score155_80_NODE_176_length_11972_cov_72_986308_g153_i0860711933